MAADTVPAAVGRLESEDTRSAALNTSPGELQESAHVKVARYCAMRNPGWLFALGLVVAIFGFFALAKSSRHKRDCVSLR